MTTNTLNPALVLPLFSNFSDASFEATSARWLSGGASIALALVSFVLTYAGYALGHSHDCLFTDVYRGAIFAIASLATALPALAVGLAGSFGQGNRMLAIIGAAISASFFVAFWMVWM
jgi:hypothetical protein